MIVMNDNVNDVNDEDDGMNDNGNGWWQYAGIAFSLYMLFGEPFAQRSGNTYRPNWENIGQTMLMMMMMMITLCTEINQKKKKNLSS